MYHKQKMVILSDSSSADQQKREFSTSALSFMRTNIRQT